MVKRGRLAAKVLSYALSRSRSASSRTSYGVSAAHGFACSKGESALRHAARSAASVRGVPPLTAARHALYVQRAVPTQRRSVAASSGDGKSRILRTRVGGGLSVFWRLDACCGFVFASLAPVVRRTLSVIARDKHGDDGEEVVGELAGLGVVATVNHDAARGLGADELDEVKGEAAEPVAVGHHNLSDSACEDAFQKGTQAGAAPVDPGGDVGDELVLWVGALEVGDLAVEVGALVGGRDAGVDDARLFRGGGRGDAGTELTLKVGDVVTPVTIGDGEPHATEVAPASQRGP